MTRETKEQKAHRLIVEDKVKDPIIIEKIRAKLVHGDTAWYIVTIFYLADGLKIPKCECQYGLAGGLCSHALATLAITDKEDEST